MTVLWTNIHSSCTLSCVMDWWKVRIDYNSLMENLTMWHYYLRPPRLTRMVCYKKCLRVALPQDQTFEYPWHNFYIKTTFHVDVSPIMMDVDNSICESVGVVRLYSNGHGTRQSNGCMCPRCLAGKCNSLVWSGVLKRRHYAVECRTPRVKSYYVHMFTHAHDKLRDDNWHIKLLQYRVAVGMHALDNGVGYIRKFTDTNDHK
jgi:hypothetical protein